ncbi:MFS transporter [Demequina lignilytica]|uniref:MFS transporter n=1 Tax=Demequina lignilytica TaxID=3051663 RepID=A0AB35MJZ3_9MICO|nr:MFS transporter [Demequina sp. SYSU T0a273]MDN4484020.1 MFS transporter [Demequina sp. SYSU T0a273]
MTPTQGFGARFALPVLTGPAMNPLNTTMIAVALVPIAEATGVTVAQVMWLVAGLYLVSSVGQPACGRLADIYGPRRVYLAGLTATAIGGIVPALWPTFTGVLVARLLIGLGTSAAYPSSMAQISAQSARLRREPPPILLSGLSMAALTSISIGPVLGGLLVHWFGWQSIFLVNVPVAIAVAVMTLRWLPRDDARVAPGTSVARAIDLPGMVLFTLTLTPTLVFLLDIDQHQWWLLAAPALAGPALIWHERRTERPFIDVRMLARNRALSRTYLRFFLSYVGIYLVTYSMTPWFQSARGLDADVTGLMMIPAAVVAFAANLIVARQPRPKRTLIIAAGVPLVGGVLVTAIHTGTPLAWVLAAIALFGIPQGLVSVTNQAVLYRQAPAGQIGTAAGLSRTALQMGAIAASVVIAGAVGDTPTDASLHTVGIVIAAVSAVVLVLVVADPGLRSDVHRVRDARRMRRESRSAQGAPAGSH